jgi:hypothetical protein
MQNRWRVDEEDIANMRRGAAAAAQGGDEKEIGYATFFVGGFLRLHGDLVEAREHLERSLAMAERIGEIFLRAQSLLLLAVTALRRHDVEAVRSLAPQAMTAAEAATSPGFVAGAKACLAWLAWQDDRPGDVVTLTNEAAELSSIGDALTTQYRWIGLWPLVATHLEAAKVAEAVAAGRQMIEPSLGTAPRRARVQTGVGLCGMGTRAARGGQGQTGRGAADGARLALLLTAAFNAPREGADNTTS